MTVHVSPLRHEPAGVDVGLSLDVGMSRDARRGRCRVCNQRRVLYRVAVRAIVLRDHGVSEGRCAECWGVR